MPKLDWIGKQYVVNHTDEVPFRLLQRIPEASMGEDSGNVIVCGDNLEALRPRISEPPAMMFPSELLSREAVEIASGSGEGLEL